MKILPSPIWPVWAAIWMASIDPVGDGLVDGDFDLHLGHEAHGIFGTAIELGVAALAAMALHFGDGDALDAKGAEGLAHLFELEWFDDCDRYIS